MAHKLRKVMGMARLSSTARLAYLWIVWTARDGYSYATGTELGERVGVSDDTISTIARELEAANLVRREAGGKGSGVKKRWALLALAGAMLTAAPPGHADAYPGGIEASAYRSLIKT